MKRLLLTLMVMLTAVCSWATGFVTVGGLKYFVDTSKREATLVANNYTGDIIVPEKVADQGVDYPVVALADDCFKYCWTLTSISLPASLTSLGKSCFSGCSGLTSITFPASLTSLGDKCFEGCSGLTSISLPASLTSLGDECFSYCWTLTSISLPASLTSLGDECFSGCSSLRSVDLPASLTSLGKSCFSGCSKLTLITLPASLTSLGEFCFKSCSGLTSITLPASLTSLGEFCFSGCKSLTSITLPASLTSLGGSCFSGCSSLTSITLPASLTSLGGGCFWGCSSLTSITLPASLTSLGGYCFSSCSSLTSITLPASLTSVGVDCFSGCAQLEKIECFAVKPPSGSSFGANATTLLYVPAPSITDYQAAQGWKDFKYILPLEGTAPEVKTCEAPTIAYANGKLQFTSATAGAEYHYTLSSADMATNAYSQMGEVELAAAYDISVYASAAGYQNSKTTTAKLFFVKAEGQIETHLNQTQMRGVVAASRGGIVTLSGLNDQEWVNFYTVDGKMIGQAQALDGEASLTAKVGEVVIAKFGESNLKIVVQ